MVVCRVVIVTTHRPVKIPSTPLFRFCWIACITGLAAAPPNARAANANWSGAGSDALWSNTANWSATPVPGSADTATFVGPAGAGGTVIDLGSGVTVNTINFSGATCAAYTIGAGAVNSQSLTLNGSLGLNGGVTFAQTITVNAAITMPNSATWSPQQGNNPYIINGNITASGTAGTTKTLSINGRSFTFNGLLADQSGGAKFKQDGGQLFPPKPQLTSDAEVHFKGMMNILCLI